MFKIQNYLANKIRFLITKFYKSIAKHLHQGGSVLLVESFVGSSPAIWKDMIKKNKLIFKKAFWQKQNILAISKRIIKIVLALRKNDLKKYFLLYKKEKKVGDLLKRMQQVYFVWSKKSD